MSEQTRNKASDFGRTARETAQRAGEQIKEASQNLGERVKSTAKGVKEQARDAADQLREQGRTMAEERKHGAADQIGHFSAAIRQAADKLHQENDHNIAGFAESIAGRVDQAANYIHERQIGELLEDARGVARRHPELVIGGMFLAGFLLARFLKSSEQDAYYEGREGEFEEEEYMHTEGFEGAVGASMPEPPVEDPFAGGPRPETPPNVGGEGQAPGSTPSI